MTEIKIIVDEYGGKDAGHGRAIAKSKNPSWMAEVNRRFPGIPTKPLADERVRNVVSWACRRTSMIACEFGNFSSSTHPQTTDIPCHCHSRPTQSFPVNDRTPR